MQRQSHATTEPARYLRVEVVKLSPNIGAEVLGVDLSTPLDGETLGEVKRALIENGVIFFRDQTLTIDQHKAFGRLWGELFVHPASTPVEGHRDIVPIKADANSTKVAGEQWHTDTSCDEAPPMGSILHMHIVPDVGGDTLFASMYAAYDALSSSIKTMLDDKTAHHSGDAAFRGFYNQDRKYPNADHPVVCLHPELGRRLLFVNRFYTTQINGLPQRESDDLLQFLFRHIETPEYQCRFRWYRNSIAFWDNRCTQHRAIFDYHPNVRSGYRIQIQGTPTIAANSAVS